MSAKKSAKKKTLKIRDAEKSLSSGKIFWILLSIVVVVLAAVFIVPGLIKSEGPDYSTYNGYSFQRTNSNLWGTLLKTGAGDQGYEFYYHPLDLENEDFNNSILFHLNNVALNNGNVSIAFTPEIANQGKAAIAGVEISKITGLYGFPTKAGLTHITDEVIEEGVEFPVFTCENAHIRNFVIIFQLGEQTSIDSRKYCTIITGTSIDELIRMADLMAYKIVGILK